MQFYAAKKLLITNFRKKNLNQPCLLTSHSFPFVYTSRIGSRALPFFYVFTSNVIFINPLTPYITITRVDKNKGQWHYIYIREQKKFLLGRQ